MSNSKSEKKDDVSPIEITAENVDRISKYPNSNDRPISITPENFIGLLKDVIVEPNTTEITDKNVDDLIQEVESRAVQINDSTFYQDDEVTILSEFPVSSRLSVESMAEGKERGQSLPGEDEPDSSPKRKPS